MKRLVATSGFAAIMAVVASLTATGFAHAADEHAPQHIERLDWASAGIVGQYDRAQLQRGFQVFQQVCTACHGLKYVRFRNLSEPGGPQFPVEAVKALAASWPYQITDGPNEEGKMIERLPDLADPIVGPYKNDKEARSVQGGALPPDLSLIVRARTVENHAPWYTHWFWMLADIVTGYQEAGADFVYAVLTGYQEAPAGVDMAEGMYYNAAFPGHQIAMVPPLSKDVFIEYQEDAGATGSLDQNAKDVTAFLAWAADPNLNTRKRLGWQVLLYLVITTLLLYGVKKRIWARTKH
jgi:cytochrome c1